MPRCPVCGKFIKSDSALATHMRFKHPDYWANLKKAQKLQEYQANLSLFESQLKSTLLKILEEDADYSIKLSELLGVTQALIEIDELKGDLNRLQKSLDSIKDGFDSLVSEVNLLKREFSELKTFLGEYSDKLSSLESRLSNLDSQITILKERLETEILWKDVKHEIESLRKDLLRRLK